jgi:DNA invertase Pin-like site-specific DNA recombinase
VVIAVNRRPNLCLRQEGWLQSRRVWKEIASGAKQERAERKKVLALAQARKVDVILVTELTRWGRSARFAARSLTCFKVRIVSSPPSAPKSRT